MERKGEEFAQTGVQAWEFSHFFLCLARFFYFTFHFYLLITTHHSTSWFIFFFLNLPLLQWFGSLGLRWGD